MSNDDCGDLRPPSREYIAFLLREKALKFLVATLTLDALSRGSDVLDQTEAMLARVPSVLAAANDGAPLTAEFVDEVRRLIKVTRDEAERRHLPDRAPRA